MELVQSPIVTDDVEGLAAFYAGLAGTPVVPNEYYVEVPAGPPSAGFSKCRFTEYGGDQAARPEGPAAPGRDHPRLHGRRRGRGVRAHRGTGRGVGHVADYPALGNHSMIFRDPGRNLVSVFSASKGVHGVPPRGAASGC